jgi:DNA mismatch repair protein MutS
MRQYNAIKAQHPEETLLFRMGDFFEMFGDDAVRAAPVLGITLTRRANGKAGDVPLAGFPHHAATTYIKKLVANGMRVAVCEQVEDPKLAKGIVKREVIEVITPGSLISDELLDGARNNFLVALALPPEGRPRVPVGFARVDLSTGEFDAGEVPLAAVVDLLGRDAPGEIVVDRERVDELRSLLPPELSGTPITRRDGWEFDPSRGRECLQAHFETSTLAGFGIDDLPRAIAAGGAALSYLQETRRTSLPHVTEVRRVHWGESMLLDAQTRRNLELTARGEEGQREGTLLGVLDATATAPGARLLRAWLVAPLLIPEAIHERQLAVQVFVDAGSEELGTLLGDTADVERIVARVAVGRSTPRDLAALRLTLAQVPALRELLAHLDTELLTRAMATVPDLEPLHDLLQRAIAAEPPARVGDAGMIADGYSGELDEQRQLAHDGKRWLRELQGREREATGISSLKVKFNRVFGYFIEVTKVNLGAVPEHYQRKQTMATAERFITPELKELEERLLHAEERAAALEARLFADTVEECKRWLRPLQALAAAIAVTDVVAALARVARDRGYTRPRVDRCARIEIEEGRHPVLDAAEMAEVFVPNDTLFDDQQRLLLITGPNMAGKSTYLRQVGLIVLLAQVGSFVPARAARIGVVDRIFTRVGTSDDLLRGRSTFLVEMVETAAILHNATPRSLVLLDEIGRGTSTYDGLALAWAITEHLHGRKDGCPRTLFATHYHELTDLATELELAANYTTVVRERGEEVVFLRRIERGVADRSYGIHVARMAGIPRPVIRRARQVLARLEEEALRSRRGSNPDQLDLFSMTSPVPEAALVAPHPLIEEMRAIDPDELSPREALALLFELRALVDSQSAE